MGSEECDGQLFMRFFGSIPVRLDFVCCVEVCCGFPCVIRIGVSFPFDQELELLAASEVAVLGNSFYFVFFRAFYEVWRWSCVVRSMRSCFLIGGE
jgi:hypothetical protein